jgi:hypothetical protein
MIRKQMRYITGKAENKRFNGIVIGPVMQMMAIVAFLTGQGPNKSKWVSKAAEKKFSDRWSEDYWVRPSGEKVSADKIRNLDTGALADSHVVLNYNQYRVLVGPLKDAKDGKARKIMQREAKWGNHAVGWDARRIRILNAELKAYFTEIAEGKTPRVMPRATVGSVKAATK